jgi:hypothetical protein
MPELRHAHADFPLWRVDGAQSLPQPGAGQAEQGGFGVQMIGWDRAQRRGLDSQRHAASFNVRKSERKPLAQFAGPENRRDFGTRARAFSAVIASEAKQSPSTERAILEHGQSRHRDGLLRSARNDGPKLPEIPSDDDSKIASTRLAQSANFGETRS